MPFDHDLVRRFRPHVDGHIRGGNIGDLAMQAKRRMAFGAVGLDGLELEWRTVVFQTATTRAARRSRRANRDRPRPRGSRATGEPARRLPANPSRGDCRRTSLSRGPCRGLARSKTAAHRYRQRSGRPHRAGRLSTDVSSPTRGKPRPVPWPLHRWRNSLDILHSKHRSIRKWTWFERPRP